MAETEAVRHPSVALTAVGIAFILTAVHLRAWPYSHPALNIVYLFWVLGAVATFIGYRSFKAKGPNLQPPTDPATLKRYRWLTVMWIAGTLSIGASFASPYVIVAIGMPAKIHAGAIALSWAVSMAVILGLMLNRQKWTALAVVAESGQLSVAGRKLI